MSDKKFDVFISYRREGGEILGRLIFELLKDDYNVFFDHESLSCGRFDTKLIDIINETSYVLVLLTKDCLERCSNPDDWFMREIEAAIDSGREIILLLDNSFSMPTKEQRMAYPPKIDTLLNYNGHEVNVAYIDGVIAKLHSAFKLPRRKRAALFDDIAGWRKIAARLGEADFTDAIPADVKDEMMKNAIKACLGKENGDIVNAMIDTSFRKAQNIRTKYRYEISISDAFSFTTLDVSEDKYYSLTEILSYTKLFLAGGIDKSFWISFSTNLDSLDEELKAENFFFSENLLIEREDMKKIIALSEEEREQFYLSDMRTRVNINGRVLSPIEIKVNEGGIFAKYELDFDAEREMNVKIRFRIPQKKTNCYFFASINDPTYSPFVSFSYPEDEMNVTMIPFLSRALTAKDTKIFDGVRELNIEKEWVLPVSGTIFIIDTLSDKH